LGDFFTNSSGHRVPGLPEGLFSNQKSQNEYILAGVGMENVSIFYDHLEYFPATLAVWYSLCSFGIFSCHFGRLV
jgi:hypothetical protein